MHDSVEIAKLHREFASVLGAKALRRVGASGLAQTLQVFRPHAARVPGAAFFQHGLQWIRMRCGALHFAVPGGEMVRRRLHQVGPLRVLETTESRSAVEHDPRDDREGHKAIAFNVSAAVVTASENEVDCSSSQMVKAAS